MADKNSFKVTQGAEGVRRRKVFYITFPKIDSKSKQELKGAESFLYRTFPGAKVKATKEMPSTFTLEQGDRPWKDETAKKILESLIFHASAHIK